MPATLRIKAMDMLARREHSRQEIEEKLIAKLALTGQSRIVLVDVLDHLVSDGLLSDKRFSESLLRSRIQKGQGPLRITRELLKRGVSKELAHQVIQGSDTDWQDLAIRVANKKFRGKEAADIIEKAKRSRFLHYRGFEAEHISQALAHISHQN